MKNTKSILFVQLMMSILFTILYLGIITKFTFSFNSKIIILRAITIIIICLFSFVNKYLFWKLDESKKDEFRLKNLYKGYNLSLIIGYILELLIIISSSYFQVYDFMENIINSNIYIVFYVILGYLIIQINYLIVKTDIYIYKSLTNNNKLITDQGLFKYVRHPRYFLFLSLYAILIIIFSAFITIPIYLILIFVILRRIKEEEKDLIKKYPEYISYIKNTKKLIPFIY